LIQVYTGNGKGKTTAALGLAVRCAGAGLKVYICQFCKGRHYSELNVIRRIKNITVHQFGDRCFIYRKPAKKDLALARKGLEKIRQVIASKKYDLVILDEINIALHLRLIDVDEVTQILRLAPKRTELVLTGRYAHPKILRLADLVSEVKEIKHYFEKGLKARKGIEY